MDSERGDMQGSGVPDLYPDYLAVRDASRMDPFPSADARRDRLARLIAMTEAGERRIIAAIDEDFGGRPAAETRLAETGYVIAAAAHAKRRVAAWMKTRSAPTALQFRPLKNSVLPQPLGVVGVMAPWNFPYHLAIAPLAGILAAGNRAMVKPSEQTPVTSAVIAELVARHFAPEEVMVIEGGAGAAEAFAALPFDHLLFTGSAEIGARVAAVAAANLTPVTLELGGKSPAIIDPSADLDLAAAQIAWAKWFNAGQTCVAPDYVLVPEEMRQPFVERLIGRVRSLYPPARIDRDYTAIATDGHLIRLAEMLDEAEGWGAEILRPLGPDRGRRMTPAIVLDPAETLAMMREEIFGPILPVLTCPDTESAVARIHDHGRPLAVYWFGTDRIAEVQVARESWCGGLGINACMLQVAQEELPFGGLGSSGQGHYHGSWGFDRFSKLKPITRRGRGLDATRFFHPPYGPTTRTAIDLLHRLVKLRS